MAVADSGFLAGNLLSYANQSFESGTQSWIAGNGNTTGIAVSSTQAFSGSKSLAFTATAAGTSSVNCPHIPCKPGMAYIASGYIYTASSRNVNLAVAWLNSSGTQIAFTVGPTVAAPGGSFAGLTFAGYAPIGAASFIVYARTINASASETSYLDLAYVAQSDVQVLVDWTNPAIGSSAVAGNAFVDITPWVRFDRPVNITRGRQDSISAVQPGKANFTIDNNLGWFTPQKTASPWYPGVKIGRRVQINLPDETGMWWTRFDGQLASLTAQPSYGGQQNLIQASCADVLSFLNRQSQMMCWTVEQTSSYNPVLQYIMNEPANAQGLRDSSGNNGPMLKLGLYSGQQYVPTLPAGHTGTVSNPTFAFQSGNNPVEGAVFPTTFNGNTAVNTSPVTSPLPSVGFSATIGASSSNLANTGCSAQFQGELPFSLETGTGQAFTIVAWVWPNIALSNIVFINYAMAAFCLANSRTGATLSIGSLPGSVGAGGSYFIQYYANFLKNGVGITSQNNINLNQQQYNGPIMVAITVSGTLASLNIGGNLNGTGISLFAPAQITLPANLAFNYLAIGGMLGGGLGWLGNISLVNVYQYALSNTQLTDLAQIGSVGTYGLTSGGSIQPMINSYTSIPPYWQAAPGSADAGSPTDYADITGQNVLSAVQAYNAVEHGAYFTDATGRVNVYERSRRMGASAPITPSQISMQQAGFVNGTGTSASIPMHTGNGLISAGAASVVVVTVPAAATITVTDSSNANTYSLIASSAGTGQVTYVFAAFNAATLSLNNSDTITVTQSVSQAYECSAYMIPNVYAVDVVNTNSGTSSTPSISTGTERGYYDFEVVIFANASSVNTNSTPNGWTHRSNFGSSTLCSDIFTKLGSTGFGASDTATAGYASSVAWSGISIAFMANTDVLPEGSYDASIAPKWNDQYLINVESLQNERGGNGIIVVNQASVDDIGEYPNGSVEAPQTAPYLTLAGSYTLRQNNIPGNTRLNWLYSTTTISDAAAWDVNTLGEPGMKLATLTCDLLANQPGQNEYIPPSNLYQQELGQLVKVNTSLPWWPDTPNSGILFIEGITESYLIGEKSITFYTSPGLQGVAWQPGSSLSGQLDATAVVGISKSGPDTPQVGVPNFTATMNLGAGAEGYVGASDLRGLTNNLQNAVTPPIAFMQQSIKSQSLATSGTWYQVVWDTTLFDTMAGFGLYIAPDYTIMLEGWYEFYLTVQVAHQGGNQVSAAIGQNQNGATRRVSPVSVDHQATGTLPTAVTTSAVFYCYQGDAVCGLVMQDSLAAVSTSLTLGGSHMSIRYLGRGTGRN